jgi:hypothetical protein
MSAQNRVLFLKGVNFQYSVEETLKNILYSQTETTSTQNICIDSAGTKDDINAATSIPDTFTSVEEWPRHTKVKCWNCLDDFKTRPLFMPGNSIKSVTGCFCSIPCLIREMESCNAHSDTRSQILYLIQLFYNKTGVSLISGPTYRQLKEFGGNMTRKDMRAEIHKLQQMILDSARS